eukprot:6447138-Lingulodinium_polyedra.AAC.1
MPRSKSALEGMARDNASMSASRCGGCQLERIRQEQLDGLPPRESLRSGDCVTHRANAPFPS